MHNHSDGLIVFYNFGYATKQDTLIMFQVNGRRTVDNVYFFHKYLKEVSLADAIFSYHPVNFNDPEQSFMTNDGNTFLSTKKEM